jgi:hypothetical protein
VKDIPHGGRPIVFCRTPASVRWWQPGALEFTIGMTSTGEVGSWLQEKTTYVGASEVSDMITLDFSWNDGDELSAAEGYYPHMPKLHVDMRIERLGSYHGADCTLQALKKAVFKAEEVIEWVGSNPVIKRGYSISSLRRMYLIKMCVARDADIAAREVEKAADPAFTKAEAKKMLLNLKIRCRETNKRQKLALQPRDGTRGFTRERVIYFHPQAGDRVDMSRSSYGSDRVAFKDVLSDMQFVYSKAKTMEALDIAATRS